MTWQNLRQSSSQRVSKARCSLSHVFSPCHISSSLSLNSALVIFLMPRSQSRWALHMDWVIGPLAASRCSKYGHHGLGNIGLGNIGLGDACGGGSSCNDDENDDDGMMREPRFTTQAGTNVASREAVGKATAGFGNSLRWQLPQQRWRGRGFFFCLSVNHPLHHFLIIERILLGGSDDIAKQVGEVKLYGECFSMTERAHSKVPTIKSNWSKVSLRLRWASSWNGFLWTYILRNQFLMAFISWGAMCGFLRPPRLSPTWLAIITQTVNAFRMSTLLLLLSDLFSPTSATNRLGTLMPWFCRRWLLV